MTDEISTLNQSPISDVKRDFGTISEIDDISFTPSISKCMENIESNTSLIDEDESHTMTHIYSRSESSNIYSGSDVAKMTFNETSLISCLIIEPDNIELAKNIHAFHEFRLKKTPASFSNTVIYSESIITHDAVTSVDSTKVSGKDTSNTGLKHLNKKRCVTKLMDIEKI